MRIDAREERFEEVTVLGRRMLFTSMRVDRKTVPEGLYLYEVRHDDDCEGEPVQIGRGIMINHWGTLIAKRPIEMDPALNGNYLDIDPDRDWRYETEESTLEEYLLNNSIEG